MASTSPDVIDTRAAAGRQPAATTLVGVQMLRAMAALMVVALHASLQVGPFGGDHLNFRTGNAGVDVFFPISGFVMVLSTAGRPASASTAGRFVVNRIVRIVPIYWLLTFAKALVALAQPAMFSGYAFSLKGLIAALLFIPYSEGGMYIWPPLKPGWTLNLEAFYYALIALVLVFSRRTWLIVPVVLTGLVAAAWAIAPAAPVLTGPQGWAAPLALEFAAGMVIGRIMLSTSRAGTWPWLALLIAIASYLFVPVMEDLRLSWGLAGVALLWAAIGLEPRFAGRRWTRLPVLIGEASYALYLTHALTQPVLAAIAGKWLTPMIGPVGLLAVLIVVPTVMAVLFHLSIEKPMTAWLKKIALADPAPRTVTA